MYVKGVDVLRGGSAWVLALGLDIRVRRWAIGVGFRRVCSFPITHTPSPMPHHPRPIIYQTSRDKPARPLGMVQLLALSCQALYVFTLWADLAASGKVLTSRATRRHHYRPHFFSHLSPLPRPPPLFNPHPLTPSHPDSPRRPRTPCHTATAAAIPRPRRTTRYSN